MGLIHCAVKGLMNLYPMHRLPLINAFECLFCLSTWSHPLIMTAGSERWKQLPIPKHATSRRHVDVHICNYVHIWEAVLRALRLYLLMSSSGSKRICGVYVCTSWSVKSYCEEFASVRQEGSNVPWGLRALLTLLQHQFNCWLVHVRHRASCRCSPVTVLAARGCVQVTS